MTSTFSAATSKVLEGARMSNWTIPVTKRLFNRMVPRSSSTASIQIARSLVLVWMAKPEISLSPARLMPPPLIKLRRTLSPLATNFCPFCKWMELGIPIELVNSMLVSPARKAFSNSTAFVTFIFVSSLVIKKTRPNRVMFQCNHVARVSSDVRWYECDTTKVVFIWYY